MRQEKIIGKLVINKNRNYDKHCSETNLSVGNLVLLYRPKKTVGKCPKLQTFWEGPYVVKERLSEVLYRIELSPSKKTMVVNGEKLRLYTPRLEVLEPISAQNRPTCSDTRNDVQSNEPATKTQSGRASKRPQWYGMAL